MIESASISMYQTSRVQISGLSASICLPPSIFRRSDTKSATIFRRHLDQLIGPKISIFFQNLFSTSSHQTNALNLEHVRRTRTLPRERYQRQRPQKRHSLLLQPGFSRCWQAARLLHRHRQCWPLCPLGGTTNPRYALPLP